ncbi:unnamed protein product [Eruca vesicaria subsp. sativa]|uniref:Uncharacterized protein n=1 Tax=Eruca vesicaria subsp. sativa TaxID=29727 RepID=A0ABC8JL27_ERUVS|nr:unnamed protein product [Eruca vesicaria subsp. sativa]
MTCKSLAQMIEHHIFVVKTGLTPIAASYGDLFFTRLKSHFEVNPRDLDLLKHDKLLSKTAPETHLKEIPEYLVDPKTQETCI